MSIVEIINELEQSDGPNRWIDARIDALFRIGSAKMRQPGYEWAWNNFPTWASHKQARGMCGVQHDTGDLGLVWDSPEFTASVDAAIGLAEKILPGWHWHIGGCPTEFLSDTDRPFSAELMGPVSWAVIDREVGEEPIYDTAFGSSASPAIALCIAILKARQAQEVQA